MFTNKIQELTPVRKTSYVNGLNDFKTEALIVLKRLRRQTRHWKGVNKAIDQINKIKPE